MTTGDARRPRRGSGPLALVGVAGVVVGALAGASVVAALGWGDDAVGCGEAAESALDGYAYDRALVVALGHAIADGHPELEALADTVHWAEAAPAGRPGEGPSGRPGEDTGAPAHNAGDAAGNAGDAAGNAGDAAGNAGDSASRAGDPAGDVAVDYLSALATLAERPELATDDVLGALRDAASASPDLNDLAPVDGDRAGGVAAISALLRRSEAYSPATEPPELTALIDEVARRQRAVRSAGMRPLDGCDAEADTENDAGRQDG
jgi:hypothetical protein